jgi:ABC-type antimicrobial peptide transport system permease subunit
MAADAAALERPIAEEAAAVQPSPLASFWSAFRENRGAVFGFAVFSLVILLALAANLVAPYSPIAARMLPATYTPIRTWSTLIPAARAASRLPPTA